MRTGMKLETLSEELQPQIMEMLKEHKSVADKMENKIEGLPATSELKTGLRTKLDSFFGGRFDSKTGWFRRAEDSSDELYPFNLLNIACVMAGQGVIQGKLDLLAGLAGKVNNFRLILGRNFEKKHIRSTDFKKINEKYENRNFLDYYVKENDGRIEYPHQETYLMEWSETTESNDLYDSEKVLLSQSYLTYLCQRALECLHELQDCVITDASGLFSKVDKIQSLVCFFLNSHNLFEFLSDEEKNELCDLQSDLNSISHTNEDKDWYLHKEILFLIDTALGKGDFSLKYEDRLRDINQSYEEAIKENQRTSPVRFFDMGKERLKRRKTDSPFYRVPVDSPEGVEGVFFREGGEGSSNVEKSPQQFSGKRTWSSMV